MHNNPLSIIVPAYNVENYLGRCLDSILNVKKEIEIIIINDGSTDKTLNIAKQYKKKYHNIKIIDKTNGGHGSAINAGLKIASGEYVRILDSDDWFNPNNLDKYLEFLEGQDADIVLTEFSLNKTNENKIIPFKFNGLKLNKKLTFSEINSIPDNIDKINIFSLHTITVKTELLKKGWGKGLLEKTFYEDQEYVTKCILAAESFIATPIDIYQYFIGRDEQSMNSNKMFKNRKQHERVIFSILDLAQDCLDKEKKDFLLYRLKKIIKTHYWIYFYNPSLTKKERQEYKELKKAILKNNHTLLDEIDVKYKLRLFLGRNKKRIIKKG